MWCGFVDHSLAYQYTQTHTFVRGIRNKNPFHAILAKMWKIINFPIFSFFLQLFRNSSGFLEIKTACSILRLLKSSLFSRGCYNSLLKLKSRLAPLDNLWHQTNCSNISHILRELESDFNMRKIKQKPILGQFRFEFTSIYILIVVQPYRPKQILYKIKFKPLNVFKNYRGLNFF